MEDYFLREMWSSSWYIWILTRSWPRSRRAASTRTAYPSSRFYRKLPRGTCSHRHCQRARTTYPRLRWNGLKQSFFHFPRRPWTKRDRTRYCSRTLKNKIVALVTLWFFKGLGTSATLGVGQFCTQPGLVFILKDRGLDEFLKVLADDIAARVPESMLTKDISDNYSRRMEELMLDCKFIFWNTKRNDSNSL